MTRAIRHFSPRRYVHCTCFLFTSKESPAAFYPKHRSNYVSSLEDIPHSVQNYGIYQFLCGCDATWSLETGTYFSMFGACKRSIAQVDFFFVNIHSTWIQVDIWFAIKHLNIQYIYIIYIYMCVCVVCVCVCVCVCVPPDSEKSLPRFDLTRSSVRFWPKKYLTKTTFYWL